MITLIATISLALLVTLATARLVRPAFATGEPLLLQGPGWALLAMSVAIAVLPSLLFGPLFGLALFTALSFIVTGRLIGRRLAGEPPDEDDLARLFIELMGPALLLAPMTLSYLLVENLRDSSPTAAQVFLSLALGFGGAGLIALIPLWPLPGGRALAVLARSLRPGLEKIVSWAMIWALTLFALKHGLILIAALGAIAGCLAIILPMRPFEGPDPVPVPRRSMLTAWGAYLTMFAAYLVAGWWILTLVRIV